MVRRLIQAVAHEDASMRNALSGAQTQDARVATTQARRKILREVMNAMSEADGRVRQRMPRRRPYEMPRGYPKSCLLIILHLRHNRSSIDSQPTVLRKMLVAQRGAVH